MLKRDNPKAFQQIMLGLNSLAKLEGKVGWFESAKYENGTPVAYVAAIQELGHGPIPPRPFMRPTADEERKKWASVAAQTVNAMVKGQIDAKGAMEAITSVAKGDVVKSIDSLNSPPLSAVTIELRHMKKQNPGLKITGKLVGQAAYRVRQPGYVAPSDVSVKPLNDTGHMRKTLTHIVDELA